MPLYRYKCFRCGKEFVTDVRYGSVASGRYGGCPKCGTLATKLNLVAVEKDRQQAFQDDLGAVSGWLRRMRRADELMSSHGSSGFGMKPYVGTEALEPAITRLENEVASAILLLLGRVGPWARRMLLQALNNPVIDSITKGVLSNASPLLVFRFCDGTRAGLAAACQGSIGHEDCLEKPWKPDRGRGTTTKASREHQRGKKKQEEGSHNSDVISTTCSLRNLVRSSAGRYACTPGGQVVPIFFGASHMPQIVQQQYARMWAPTIVLILIPPGSYVIDWEDFLVNSSADNTSADVSFFEREVSYDTFGGSYHLADEIILFIGGNPFHGMVQSSSSSGLHLKFGSSKKPVNKKPPFGGPSFGKPPFGGPPFDPKGGSGSFFT